MIWKEIRENAYCEITPAIMALKEQWEKENYIDPQLYKDYNVKRGLRNEDGRGVLTGLTRVAEIQSYTVTEDEHIRPADGVLYYRGIDCREVVRGSESRGRYAFEETAYLLLFGQLPDQAQLDAFCDQLASYRTLPTNFFRDIIMKAPPQDLMNTMQRAVLTLACYDDKPNDIGLENVLRQSLQLLSNMPVLAIYAYQAWRYTQGESLFIHVPQPELSTAENFLRMLREDRSYTELEARVLDVALVLHADHGGGNNSTFTTHVVTSSGTDTYSCMTAALASLKGPRHGGANIKVVQMFDEMMNVLKDWSDEEEVAVYLKKLLHKEAFDHAGLIYGVGHAVYSKSDPRAVIFKNFVEKLSVEKGLEKEFNLYSLVEKLAPQVIAEERQIYKGVSVNVDFYSGFVYKMLGLPQELFTPIFAIARIVGWSAHRMEELANNGKIIRPAYKPIGYDKNYMDIEERR